MNCIFCYCKLIKYHYPKTATSAPLKGRFICSSCDEVSYTFNGFEDNKKYLDYISFKLNKKDLSSTNIKLDENHGGFFIGLDLEFNTINIHEYIYYKDYKIHMPRIFYQGPWNKDISPKTAPQYIERIFNMKAFL